jgi:anti-anti-sigma factor
MDIAVEDLGRGATKVVLQGRLDTTRAVLMELPFQAAIADKTKVILDLSSVDFLSSYALRVLLVGAKVVEGKGGKLAIVCRDANVAKVLRTARTSDLLPVFDDDDAAIAAVVA